MIITRSWLNEFIDLSSISNEKLYTTFNAIGLEVDSMNEIEIPQKVVVGKIISCEKHPDADKLNICQIDIGATKPRQIVCGAANVVDARYVAVAMIGAILPGNLEIKHAKLRGVESEGMVCASSEIGLPAMGKGIMQLDESIGSLAVGRELSDYPTIADTIIELELTANRGDCLCIYGVARDLSAALDIAMHKREFTIKESSKYGIGRTANLSVKRDISADMHYKFVTPQTLKSSFLIDVRLAMVSLDVDGILNKFLAYSTYTTGVILRAYEASAFRDIKDKVSIVLEEKEKGLTEVLGSNGLCSIVGVQQNDMMKAIDESKEILLEASYIHPDTLVEAVSTSKLKTDDLYYKTSRGSNPDILFGFSFLAELLHQSSDISCLKGSLEIAMNRKKVVIMVDAKEVSSIIGMPVELGKITIILKKLGFGISAMGTGIIGAIVPLFRHDIVHIQDIAEEIVRIIGINNIPAKALSFVEAPRLNATTKRYKIKRAFRNRAVGLEFYENISYIFSHKTLLEKYGFTTVEESLDIVNPIAEELNTLRSTLLINLLLASQRNVHYSKKSISLFEIGAVYNSVREQKEMISFVVSGHKDVASINNAGKPKMVDFSDFVKKIGGVIGAFDLVPCSYQNNLIHPYQSANIIVEGKMIGFISKLHPTVQEEFDLAETFIAELDFESLLPKHQYATPISKFQGVYKDLSLVVDKVYTYTQIAQSIKTLNLSLLKSFYPVDVYEDEALKDRKSVTVRFFIQAMEKTLEESDIESVMQKIIVHLEKECQATLR